MTSINAIPQRWRRNTVSLLIPILGGSLCAFFAIAVQGATMLGRSVFLILGVVGLAYAWIAKARSSLTLCDGELEYRTPLRSWSVAIADIIAVQKVRGAKVTGVRLLTSSGQVFQFGLTNFGPCADLSQTLTAELSHARFSTDAARLFARAKDGLLDGRTRGPNNTAP